jgi:ComF family protein
MVTAGVNALIRVLLSPRCAGCAAPLPEPLRGPICRTCWQGVPLLVEPLCVRCGDPLASWRAAHPLCARCRRRRPRFALARSAGLYDGPMREILHGFKYGGQRSLAGPLAALVVRAGRDVLAGADAVVPVPLHPLRRIERGFNQADDLARCLRRPVWRVLRRVRLGPPQASLPAARRHANVSTAFGLTPVWLAPSRWRRALAGTSVVLVDDVMTTGATLDACSRVLLAAGVRRVGALTVARAAAGPRSRRHRRPRPAIGPRR